MDPLSIASKAGEGEAVIFKSDYKDPYDIYTQERARRDALLLQKKNNQAKVQQQRLKDLEDLSKLSVEGHISFLDEEGQMKNKMIEKASAALLKSGGTADVYKEIYPELTEFQKVRDTAKQVETWASQVGQTINADRNKLDDMSVDEVKSFLKLKPADKKTYLLEKGGFPQLKHKEDFIDYNKSLRDIGKQIGQKTIGTPVRLANGDIETQTTKTTPVEFLDNEADKFVKSGLVANPNPAASKLIADTKVLLENDPLFNNATPEEQTMLVFNKAKEYARREMQIVQDEENRKTISLAPKETASEKVIDVIPEREAEVNVGMVGTGEKSEEAVKTGAVDVTRWRFPKTVTVQANPNTVFDINTGKAEKSFGDYKMTVSEVVEAPVVTDKEGNFYMLPKDKVAEYKKRYPDMKGVSSRKFASVIYENEEGEEVKKYIPYEVIENQIKEQKLNLKGAGEVSTEKLTEKEWNVKWSNLKKGDSMVGLDGKTYTKK